MFPAPGISRSMTNFGIALFYASEPPILVRGVRSRLLDSLHPMIDARRQGFQLLRTKTGPQLFPRRDVSGEPPLDYRSGRDRAQPGSSCRDGSFTAEA